MNADCTEQILNNNLIANNNYGSVCEGNKRKAVTASGQYTVQDLQKSCPLKFDRIF